MDSGVDQSFDFWDGDDIPVSGRWSSATKDYIGTYSKGETAFYLDWDGNFEWNPLVDKKFYFKPTNSINAFPIVGDWNDDGRESIGLFDADSATFYLDWDADFVWNPQSDVSFRFGLAGDRPIAGKWLKRERFWMADHLYRPNPTYMSSALVLFADSFLVYKKANKRMPIEFSHNVIPLWEKLKESLNVNNFEWTFLENHGRTIGTQPV